MPLPPYRRVGNVFVVRCIDHLFKHGPEVNAAMRCLRFEFKGQVTVHPDIPNVRKQLFIARHCVSIDMLDLDEAKATIGIPAHINFTDLARQLPVNSWRGPSQRSPLTNSKVSFTAYRRARLHDVLERDDVEKRLLAKRKLQRSTTPVNATQ